MLFISILFAELTSDNYYSPNEIRRAEYLFVMHSKMMSFSQLPAVKKTSFGEHDKQIFGPSYFVAALAIV